MKKIKQIDPNELRPLRKKLSLNQSEFWSTVGVTQSGGSRYESGRFMPKPVSELVRIVHKEGVNLSDINAKDLKVGKALKKSNPDLYKELLKV